MTGWEPKNVYFAGEPPGDNYEDDFVYLGGTWHAVSFDQIKALLADHKAGRVVGRWRVVNGQLERSYSAAGAEQEKPDGVPDPDIPF